MVGKAIDHFEIWQASIKADNDKGISELVGKVKDYARRKRHDQAVLSGKAPMDIGQVKVEDLTDDQWEELNIGAVQKGKGKGKGGGFKGKCYACGEYGHSQWNCPKFPKGIGKGGKDGGKGEGKGKGKGKGEFRGTCYACGEWGHSARFCPHKYDMKGSSKGGIGSVWDGHGHDHNHEDNYGQTLENEGEDMEQSGRKRVTWVDRELGSVDKGKEHKIMSLQKGQWERIRMQVDSGAIDTVIPKDMGVSVPLRPTLASKLGIDYVAANGTKIGNHGERMIRGVTDEGRNVKMAMQVADVNKPLGSVYRMNQAGNKVVFDGEWSYVENKKSGRKNKINLIDGKYMMDLWVKGEGKKGV